MKFNYLFFILLLFCLTSCTDKKVNQSPNIILFLVDDMGWQDTSVPFWKEKTPFNERYRTPNMERLAAQGMKFTQAYATPVCSPTRISLMTGMNAARHRVTNWTLRKGEMKDKEKNHPDLEFPLWNVNGLTPDSTLENAVYAKTFPMLLQEAGYHTIHAGKAHLGAIGTLAENPLNVGFDVNIAGHAAGAPASYHGTDNFGNTLEMSKSPWAVPGLEKYYGQDIFLTEAITQEAKLALDKSIKDKNPFFLYMSLYGIHTPIMPNNRFVEKYYKMGMDSTEAKYASMIESMDKSLGDLMDYLEDKKIAENTIILFMSDNGGLSAHARGGKRHTHNKPLSSGKGSIYEGGIREPMLVKWTGVTPPNSVNDEYLIIEDFYPTILEMAGITSYQTPQVIDGKSFVETMKKTTTAVQNRPIFWHFPNQWGGTGPGIGAFSAVRKGDWKLIYYHENERFEIFNLKDDIGEMNNLSPFYREQLRELSAVLGDYLNQVNAQMPIHKETGKRVMNPKNKAISFIRKMEE